MNLYKKEYIKINIHGTLYNTSNIHHGVHTHIRFIIECKRILSDVYPKCLFKYSYCITNNFIDSPTK